jgi:hypothetical protein
MIKRIKISQLPAAGAAQGADVMPVVQSGETRKQTQSAVELNALSTAQAAAADASQALIDAADAQTDATAALIDAAAAQLDATAALAVLPDKSDKAVTVTGNVGLAVSEVHGSHNSPQSGGNITVNITGAIIDTLSRVYHQHSSEPTITVTGTGAGTAAKYGAGVYDPNKVNIIGIWYDQNGNVGYGILPEQ